MKETTKEQVLKILKASSGAFCSGQEIAEKLYVTRASVWKAIRSLQSEGQQIEAVRNRGYRLLSSDELNAEKIRLFLKEYAGSLPLSKEASAFLEKLSGHIHVFDEVDSTNIVVNRFSPGPSVAIADRQTAGKGRKGRSFHSPAGTGIYLSLLMYPDDTLDLATGFTCMMAIAVCHALSSLLKIEAEIKWVNDLFYKGKKVCGILTEGNVSVEDNRISSVVVGMGLNVYCPAKGFPKELKDVATSLLDTQEEDLRNKLIAAILCEFASVYFDMDRDLFAKEYKSRSLLIGKYVRITDFSENKHLYALVEDIDDACHLCVKFDDGKRKALSSGEVSIARY